MTGGIVNATASSGATTENCIFNGTVYGSFTLSEDCTLAEGQSITIPSDAALTIAEGVTLTNNGFIYVDGTLGGTVDDNVYYPLTVINGEASGDVSSVDGQTYGKQGGAVTLTGIHIPAGKILIDWSGITVTDRKFTMPAQAVTITAEYGDMKDGLFVDGNPAFDGQTEVWIDGVSYPILEEGGRHVVLPDTGYLLTIYTYKQSSSAPTHDNYPTGMAVYRIVRSDGGATVEEINELNDLLRYSGCSIRITGELGIRMITSLTKEAKTALTKANLAGHTLEEYGTVVQWADKMEGSSLTLANGNHNYAYRKGVSDPVFANVGDLTQYTNVLVWDELEDYQGVDA